MTAEGLGVVAFSDLDSDDGLVKIPASVQLLSGADDIIEMSYLKVWPRVESLFMKGILNLKRKSGERSSIH
jgi:hypothetical protein